mmetsp:Transcript_38052/g.122166  ORF Transcript_38052/g.122166 Transcript_38052/m.122166 type:complete len:317 (-) Transcript_38052:277-1227(-)
MSAQATSERDSRILLAAILVEASSLSSLISHLFAKMTQARPSCLMRRARAASWSVGSTVESSTSKTTSARFTASKARPTIFSSGPALVTLVFRRTPAVSTKRKVLSSTVTDSSTASRVVPGVEDTMLRGCPRNRLSNDDFPTFGRPRNATSIWGSSSSTFTDDDDDTKAPPLLSCFSFSAFAATASHASSIDGSNSSRTSATPLPWIPEHAMGSPRPRHQKSAARETSVRWFSHLLTATTVRKLRFRCFRKNSAICSSMRVRPSRPSTTRTAAQLSARATWACSRISSAKRPSLSSNKRPPVSTTSKSRPSQVACW